MWGNKKSKHEHKWKVFNVSFTQPDLEIINRDLSVVGPNAINKVQDFLEDARTGFTHFYLKCTECGDINYRTVPGIVPRKEKEENIKTLGERMYE